MKTVTTVRGDSLLGVLAGGTAEDDGLHGAVGEEGLEISEGFAAVLATEVGDLFSVDAVDGGDLGAGDSIDSAGVGFRDVAAAN